MQTNSLQNGELILIHQSYNNYWIGVIINNLYKDYIGTILLLNDDQYIDPIANIKGVYILKNTDKWKQVKLKHLPYLMNTSLLNLNIKYKVKKNIKAFMHNLYQTGGTNSNADKLKKDITNKISESINYINVNPPSKNVYISKDMQGEAIYEDRFQHENDNLIVTNNRYNIFNNNTLKEVELTNDDTLFSKMGIKLDIELKHEHVPDLGSDIKKLHEYFENYDKYIDKSDEISPLSRILSFENHITDEKDMEAEGRKMIDYINNIGNIIDIRMGGNGKGLHELKNIFTSKRDKNYVIVFLKGVRPYDYITTNHIKNLEAFPWQYNKPIQYRALEPILRSDIIGATDYDQDQRKEAELILSQEYIFALQPKFDNQMLVAKLLLIAWLTDPILTQNIRLVKILINQYRARSDLPYNKTNGTLPSIVIYLKYGRQNIEKVGKRLAEHFILKDNMGWNGSNPSYFSKMTNIIWYANGAYELKLKYRKLLEYTNNQNKSFADNYTKFKEGKDLLDKYGTAESIEEIDAKLNN